MNISYSVNHPSDKLQNWYSFSSECWASACDTGPAFSRQWPNVSSHGPQRYILKFAVRFESTRLACHFTSRIQVNTKELHTIYRMSKTWGQRCVNVKQMFFFVFSGITDHTTSVRLIRNVWINPLTVWINRWNIVVKLWSPRGFANMINVLVSSFRFIWIFMWWV